jgi:hypothetical protein
MSNISIYTAPEALAKGQTLYANDIIKSIPIVATRRGNVTGAKYVSILLPSNNLPSTTDVPAAYKAIIDRALLDAAKQILHTYAFEGNNTLDWIPESLLTADAILRTASSTTGSWLSKEQVEKGWLTCSARAHLLTKLAALPDSGKRAYLAKINLFAEPILKMAGKKNDMLTVEQATKQLEQFISFTDENAINNEFEQFVIMRYERIINKVEESNEADTDGL